MLCASHACSCGSSVLTFRSCRLLGRQRAASIDGVQPLRSSINLTEFYKYVMKSCNAGSGLQAEERCAENQWRHHLPSNTFGLKVTAFENNRKELIWK